ncbi:MAG TPA: response regulator [Gemmatimonadales bacterium]|nr:response regulator [Gemmatimonadales bacterium]
MTTQPCTGCVLIVDDEEDTRELIRDLLEAKGFAVATAEDGQAALNVLASVPRVCLMILDLLMPNMNGFEVLQRLSADPAHQTVPVWVSTSAPDIAPEGIPCLPKPVDVQQLVALVHAHCAAEPCG